MKTPHCHLILILVIATFCGCASRTLRVQSAPEGADVLLVKSDASVEKLGKTPLDLDVSRFSALDTNSIHLRVSKDGYTPQSALMPSIGSLGGSARLNINLSSNELPKVCLDQEESMNVLARGIADAGGLIQRRKLAEAASLLQALILKFNSVSVLYDLQGNVYYLQRNTSEALNSYRKSNSLSPSNPQTQKMIETLSRQQPQTQGGE